MSINNVEKFKERMKGGQMAIGICLGLADPIVSELLADAGYDFTWIDMEHGAFTLPVALSHVMACRGTGCAPLVRVPSHDPVAIKPILELAPAGIIVPRVQTAAEVRTAVAASKYPPAGIRGYGPLRAVGFKGMDMKAYLNDPEVRDPMVFVQIEDIQAVNNIDAILAVEGLDGIIFGPNDLSGTMGMLGNPGAPEVVEKIDLVMAKARKAGKPMGTATGYGAKSFGDWLHKGLNFIALNADFINMFAESKRILEDARKVK